MTAYFSFLGPFQSIRRADCDTLRASEAISVWQHAFATMRHDGKAHGACALTEPAFPTRVRINGKSPTATADHVLRCANRAE